MLTNHQGLIPIRRHLSLVHDSATWPDSWVPSGRVLHVNDVENLVGGPFAPDELWTGVRQQYESLAPIGPDDHVVAACNPRLVLKAARLWHHSRWLTRTGPNGADLALLDALDPDDIARRYHRVVIGSGDGAFAPLAQNLRQRGVEVHVIARGRSISRSLADAAHVVGLIHLPVATIAPAADAADDHRDAA